MFLSMKTFHMIIGILCLNARIEKAFAEDVLTITRLYVPKSGTGIVVCYSGSGETFASAILTALVLPPTAGEGMLDETHTETPSADNCITFEKATPSIFANKNVRFFVSATKTITENNNGFGTVDLQFADTPSSVSVEKIGTTLGSKIIRLNGDLNGQEFHMKPFNTPYSCPFGTAMASLGPPCYFMDIPYQDAKDFQVCQSDIRFNTNEGDPVLYCAEVASSDVHEIQVTVNGPGYETVTLDNANAQITLASTMAIEGAPTNAEIVITSSAGEVLSICQVETNGVCPLVIADSETYTILIVYTTVTTVPRGTETTTTEVLSYDTTQIINRNLVGAHLTPDVIQASWTFDKANPHHQIKKEPQNGDFYTADVNCEHMNTECFVYFTGLNAGAPYTVTLGNINNWDKLPDKPAAIDPELQTSGVDDYVKDLLKPKSNNIDVGKIQVRQEVSENSSKFYFKYDYKMTNRTERYEVILINNKGKWRKSFMNAEFDGNHYYSTVIDFPLEQLDEDSTLTMVIVARNVNTNKVLATGEMHVSALRVIEPEVDNGSNGSTSTLAIIGAAIGGIACLVALVAAAIMFVMKTNRDNDGLQYPLHRNNIEDSSINHGIDNPIPTM